MNIVIPCAGAGTRFRAEGYKDIKPFIKVKDKLMIEWVISNLVSKIHYQKFIFLFQKEHIKQFKVSKILDGLARKYELNYELVEVNGLTCGAACTILLAKDFIDNTQKLVIANSDQYVQNFDIDRFLGWSIDDACSILTFKATDKKWSFVKPKNNIEVEEVVEKNPVSNIANVGIFKWEIGLDCIQSIEEMMKDESKKINGEWYLAPSINKLIGGDRKITFKMLESYQHMCGLGTPEDMEYFIKYK